MNEYLEIPESRVTAPSTEIIVVKTNRLNRERIVITRHERCLILYIFSFFTIFTNCANAIVNRVRFVEEWRCK